MANPTQTTYAENQEIGTPGQLVNGENFNAFSRTVETAAGIAFGVPVAQGAADRGCIIMANGLKATGITRRNPAVVPGNGDKYAQYAEAAIIDEGVVWGRAEEVVAARAQAFWNPATGKWVAGPATANDVKIDGAIYDTSAAANGLVAIRVRIPAV